MAALDENFNKSSEISWQTLQRDIIGLSERSGERCRAFYKEAALAESDAKRRERESLAERVTVGSNMHESEPRLTPGITSKAPRVTKEQVEAFFEKMEQKGITSASQVTPENKVEQIIQHTWQAVQNWERDQEKGREQKRFEDTRAFVDKLMTLDEFNLAASTPRGPHDGRTR